MRIAFEAKPSRVDPRYASDAYSARVVGLVFVSLVTPGADGGFRPYLARSWRWDDALTCTFDLTEGFGFEDGRPVRADDVVATFQAVLAADSGSPRRSTLSKVLAVEAVGGTSVRFHLSEPDAAFFEGATLGVLASEQAALVNPAAGELLASGPYRVGSVEPDGSVGLVRNPHFLHAPVPIPRIHIRVIPDALTRVLELENGSVDLVQSAIDPDTVDWLARRDEDIEVTRTASANFQYLGINLRHAVLADVRVRRALAHAIDRDAITREIFNGQARTADSMLPPEHWAHTKHVHSWRYDPQHARALLDRAGLRDPDGDGPQPRVSLDFKTTTEDLSRRIAEVLAAQLAAVGIELRIRSYDWGTFFADIQRGEFHLYSLQWVGIADPDILRQVLHSELRPPLGSNRGGFVDRRTDRLTELARGVMDPDMRRRLYARVERRAARLLPYVPLWWPERVIVSNRRLTGFQAHPAGDLLGLLEARLEPLGTR